MGKKKILITGAAGLCGSVLYDGLLRLGYKVIGCDIKKKPSSAANNLGIKINNNIKIVDLRKLNKVLKNGHLIKRLETNSDVDPTIVEIDKKKYQRMLKGDQSRQIAGRSVNEILTRFNNII